jgi:hypothetical protein
MSKTAAQLAIEALDETARAMEVKWGCGRLPRLVAGINPELAGKFWSQFEKLNAACETGYLAEQEIQATRMRAAWMRLDREAEADGCEPISPKRLEGRLPDGRLLVVVDGPEGAWRVAHEDRAAVVWSIDEVVRMLWSFEMVNEAKTVWPGAKVRQIRIDPESTKPPVDWSKGDELPFEMLRAG